MLCMKGDAPMLLNEIAEKTGMTKRAVKYYEEKGLLSVRKKENGYRDYTAQDAETLKRISVCRKLGIGIRDIKMILETDDQKILLRIYQQKLQEKEIQESELSALKEMIDHGDAEKADELLDYRTVENALRSLLPDDEWSEYLIRHFHPFLNVPVRTTEQKQALKNILEYCDETHLRSPFLIRLSLRLAGGIRSETRTADEMISYYRDMSEAEYERLKAAVLKGVKLKSGILKFHPVLTAQRKMMKEYQNRGFNDILIPNLMVLSPKYAEYKKALNQVNDRICRELGLYYDDGFNLIMKGKQDRS